VAESAAADRSLDARIAAFVRESRVAGAAAGVVIGDDLVWWSGCGFAGLAERKPPQASTLYHIASVTKTFTGTAVLRLCQDGRLHLDDPAVAHLPELRRAASPFGPIETVTIRRMLSHESGLASDPPGTDWAVPAYEGVAERTLARAADIGTKVPPNIQWKYSNLAYQLLGEIVSRASRMPYVQYVTETILDPLAMSSTGFEPLPESLRDRRATGYLRKPFSDEHEPAPAMSPEWAEGGLWSCVDDLARWLSFQLRAHREMRQASPVLAAATLRDMHKPRYIADDTWTTAWGISWYAVRRDDTVWIQHAGDVHGFSSAVCFSPDDQVGAIVLLNGMGDAARLAMDLATAAGGAFPRPADAITPPAAAPEAFRELLGMYALPEMEMFIRLEWRGGKLTFINPADESWRPTLAPTENPGVFVVEPGYRESGEPVAFRRLADGRIAAMFLASATFARLGSVRPELAR
jgi:CubicO group peptidase (beta-lactamase class C family)